ncbi:MAG: class I SAM-dependent methyltransferase [Acidobacteriales bacterium]|nr:class I SAM-dependent methyltransferase [Terriglobales bacterium]
MEHERDTWDQRYRSGSHRSLDPDPLLVESYRDFIEPLFPQPGTALDVAGGAGRHAAWLAHRGWRVTLVDVSAVAIEQARANAGEVAEKIKFEVGDLESFELGTQPYDLVLVFFYLQRDLFPRLIEALKPGGLLIYKTYTHMAPKFGRGPSHPMHLLGENELLHAVPEMTVLHYLETVHERGIAELVARKRSPSTR